MDRGRRDKARIMSRLASSVASIRDDQLYFEAQALVGRIHSDPDRGAAWIELVECLARWHEREHQDHQEEAMRAVEAKEAAKGAHEGKAARLKEAAEEAAKQRKRGDNPEIVRFVVRSREGGQTLAEIANSLGHGGFRTPGGAEFTAVQVSRILKRAGREDLRSGSDRRYSKHRPERLG